MGSFVLVIGMVSRLARRLACPQRSTLQVTRGYSWLSRLFLSTLLLGGIGMVRLVVTWAVNYQLHASEYGVHWNFFFTLGLLLLLDTLLDTVVGRPLSSSPCLVFATALTVAVGELSLLLPPFSSCEFPPYLLRSSTAYLSC